ncbi:MAG: amino acid ABC transporter permease [Clostridia bacterium]
MTSWKLFYNSFIVAEGYKNVLLGLRSTVIIAICGLVLGIIIGTLIAISKVVPSKKPFFRIWSGMSDVYVWLFRGTPIVVQLLIVYYVLLPLIGVRVDAIIVACVTFGLNSGAYVSEIMRGGILSVDSGQMEAGRSLGMSYTNTMFSVVIPQSIKNIMPTLGNEFITLIKETSVVSFIAVVDLTLAFKQIGNSNYEYIIPYCMLALVYLALVSIITVIVKSLERRMRKSDRNN